MEFCMHYDKLCKTHGDVDTLTKELDKVIQDATSQGYMVHVPGKGSFFVEWHILPDLKCLKILLGMGSCGSKRRPCPFCDVPDTHLGDMANSGTWPARNWEGTRVFPLPMHRFHLCTMHCHHRVCEKILMEILTYVVQQRPPQPHANTRAETKQRHQVAMQQHEAYTQSVMDVLNKDMQINGGHCRLEWDDKKQKWSKIPLNGGEIKRLFRDKGVQFVARAWLGYGLHGWATSCHWQMRTTLHCSTTLHYSTALHCSTVLHCSTARHGTAALHRTALQHCTAELQHCTALHCTAVLNCTAILRCTVALHCTSLFCTALQDCTAACCSALRCATLHCAVLHCNAMYCTALHCTALHCTALHCIAQHCTALHYAALHYTALHCTALHCTAPR